MHTEAREAGAAGARAPTLTEGQLLSIAEGWYTTESFTDQRRNVKSELCLGQIYTTAPQSHRQVSVSGNSSTYSPHDA